MDLLCSEVSFEETNMTPAGSASPSEITAAKDDNLLKDVRVLQSLLTSEMRCLPLPASSIFDKIQTDVRPNMRKVLTSWMLEVCEELQCEMIFPLATNYLDRYLSLKQIDRHRLQLLGAVCLLIASKLKQCKSIHPEDLVFYSDNSLTTSEITEWEVMVLETLNWDVSAVVSSDFVDHLMARLHLILKVVTTSSTHEQVNTSSTHSSSSHGHLEEVTRFSHDLCLLTSREIEFVHKVPSVVATGAVATALKKQGIESCIQLAEITGLSVKDIVTCVNQIEQVILNEKTSMTPAANIPVKDSNGKHPIYHHTKSMVNNHNQMHGSLNQPETPTDLSDILF